MEKKPALTKFINLNKFKKFYWLKAELIEFCRKYDLSRVGSKKELLERIEIFISTGNKLTSPTKKKIDRYDSEKPITRDTPVVHYKNDAATRMFFVNQIGNQFHFNNYLRQFANKTITTSKSLTYGDLVNGWIAAESRKKDPNYQSIIGNQFEYNQFIRDFFSHGKEKTRADAIKAWKIVKAVPGPNTYAFYKTILSQKK